MKILFVKTHALGDVLMTTPTLRHVAMQCPDNQYDFLTGRQAALLLLNNPHLHEQIYIDEGALFGWKKHLLLPLISRLKRNGYDRACVFAPGAEMLRLLGWAGIKEIFAPSAEKSLLPLAGSLPWEPMASSYIGEFYLKLARLALGLPPEVELTIEDLLPELNVVKEGQDIIDKLLAKLSLGQVPLLLVAPGGGRNVRQEFDMKKWSPEKFAEVAAHICKDYGLYPVLVGSKQDCSEASVIWKLWGEQGLNLCGSTTLLTLPALINRAGFLLCNDSLPMHMALALGKPFVAIFGPTSPRALLPPAYLQNAVTPNDCDCAPCCANMLFKGCTVPKPQRCIDIITVEEVLAKVGKIFKQSQGSKMKGLEVV